MPNPAQGARLRKRKDRRKDGSVEITWYIRDGNRQQRTGCRLEDRAGAERALQAYLETKWKEPSGPSEASELKIATALATYGEARREAAAHKTIGFCITALLSFWADLPVSAVKGETCRRYAKHRREQTWKGRKISDGTVRRELGVLSAAFQHCHKEGLLTNPPAVTLPPMSQPRERWLTRSEAARLLWAARRTPHLARFVLIGLYTGSRSKVIRNLQWLSNMEGGHVDLDRGVLYRQPAGAIRTNKRAPAARLPRKLLNHLRRWARLRTTRQWIVEWDGKQVSSIKTAWRSARFRAELGADVVPHILRHTAITWMLQGGAKDADVRSLAGITQAELERTYAHHSPDHQKSAVDALGG